jgi:hypothetical protein
VGYHDDSLGNNGGAYRFEDVDVRQTGDFKGFQVGWTDPGEWLSTTSTSPRPASTG